MSKIKRKVTVDSDDRRKPSVFERLGPGATRRSYGNYDDSDSDVRNDQEFASTGFFKNRGTKNLLKSIVTGC